jgi:hypothetical protein
LANLGGCACGDYELPENLKTFYEGKGQKSALVGELLLMEKKKLIRIVAPILIVLVVAGIWLVKNVVTVEKDLSTPQSGSSGGEQAR